MENSSKNAVDEINIESKFIALFCSMYDSYLGNGELIWSLKGIISARPKSSEEIID
jgi:hypothetical protein